MNTPLDPIRSKRVPRFVEEYCKDRNGTQAAVRAGYSSNLDTAGVTAARLLSDARIQALIVEQMARVSQEAKIEAADILREWLDVATADPAKLSHVRQVNCRHCWGVGHEYQWKAREYAEACDRAMKAYEAALAKHSKGPAPTLEMPDCSGGFGFSRIAEPNPACPECEGEGVEDVIIADLASLSGPERKLFAGIKRTRNGVEVVMRDQDKARDNLAKYLGMLVERKELTGPDGKPLIPAAPPVELPNDPQALGVLYGQIVSD